MKSAEQNGSAVEAAERIHRLGSDRAERVERFKKLRPAVAKTTHAATKPRKIRGDDQTESYCAAFGEVSALAKLEEALDLPNRNVSNNHAEALALEMRNGTFREFGPPLIVDAHDVLLDGQHRLWAVALSKVEVRFKVEKWLWCKTPQDRKEALRVIDCGRRRTVGNVIDIEGKNYGNMQAAIARMLATWEQWHAAQKEARSEGKTGLLSTTPASYAPLITRADQFAEIDGPSRKAIAEAAAFVTVKMKHSGIRTSSVGFAYVLCGNVSHEDRDTFFGRLAEASQFRSDDPTVAMLMQKIALRRDMSQRSGAKKNSSWMVPALVIKAWNHFRSHASGAPKNLRWSGDESFPEVK